MKSTGMIGGLILAGAILGLSAVGLASAQPAAPGRGISRSGSTAPAQPGLGGGWGRGWGAQMRRAQQAQKTDASSSSATAGQAVAAPAGCPGCCMMGGCMMAASASASTSPSLQKASGENQTPQAAPGMGMGRGMGMGGPGPRPDMREAMPVIHDLLAQHDKVKRKVENIPQGIVSETISVDLEVAAQIRKHADQMKKRLEQGLPMRMMDPLFREIFRNSAKISMKIEAIPGGVRVTETSADPKVQLLIRQHAQAVVKFVEQGMPAAMEIHDLPTSYTAAKGQ